MDIYRPSRFDRMLDEVDATIRQGMLFAGDEAEPFDDLPRPEWVSADRHVELGRDD